jgi:hypothetical protein
MSYPWVRKDDDPPWVNGAAVATSYGTMAPAAERELRGLAHEIRDEDIERDKPGYRGLFLAQLKGILDRCDDGDPEDPRWDELRLRCLDRFAKLARVYEPDAPGVKAGPGNPRDLADRAAAQLVELEASLAETRAH